MSFLKRETIHEDDMALFDSASDDDFLDEKPQKETSWDATDSETLHIRVQKRAEPSLHLRSLTIASETSTCHSPKPIPTELSDDPDEGFDDIEFPQDLRQETDFPDEEELLTKFGVAQEQKHEPVPFNIPKPTNGSRKPILIKPTDTIQAIGGMVFDSELQKWQGNESCLDAFEKPSQKPQLIPHSFDVPDKVGTMVYDPVNMTWIGNEEDARLFDHIDNLVVPQTEPKNSAFTLSKQLEQKFAISESSHKLFIGSWYPRVVQSNRLVVRDTSK
ncbi:hypothetical protein EDD86DRAFT_275659, partial [Gorgonomyces haynaldii]